MAVGNEKFFGGYDQRYNGFFNHHRKVEELTRLAWFEKNYDLCFGKMRKDQIPKSARVRINPNLIATKSTSLNTYSAHHRFCLMSWLREEQKHIKQPQEKDFRKKKYSIFPNSTPTPFVFQWNLFRRKSQNLCITVKLISLVLKNLMPREFTILHQSYIIHRHKPRGRGPEEVPDGEVQNRSWCKVLSPRQR